MKNKIHRKNFSEVLISTNFNDNRDTLNTENVNPNKIHEENIFLESFSDIPRLFNMNEELSVLEANNIFGKNQSHKSTNKVLIKIITLKFHELYLKLVNQIKMLKMDLGNMKKKGNQLSLSDNKDDKEKSGIYFINFEANLTSQADTNEHYENETETLKYLMNEELECFNQILFDSNIQLNELQSQEEGLRREILKKHKEIEKLNSEVDEYKKQKDFFVKELQNIAIKLNEYKLTMGNINTESKCNCPSNAEKTEFYDVLDKAKSMDMNEEENEISAEEFNLLVNSDNREYLIKKVLQENKKYKSIVKVLKTEEAEMGNYLLQVESELDNFSKFKNFCLSKMNTIDEGVTRCRENMDGIAEKITNLDMQIESFEEMI